MILWASSTADLSQLGVTSTNVLVDVVDFFGQNVFSDLQAAPGSVHPILVVDAIKFLYTFRNQVRMSSFSHSTIRR
jgi:exportin-2 (importin alpha re-exporter)